MAYTKSDRYTLALYDVNAIRTPAVEQESQRLGYNDEVEVTIFPEDSDVDSVTTTQFVNSGCLIPIPVSIIRKFGLEGTVEVSMEATGGRWSPEVGASARKAVYESAHPEETELKAVTDVVSADD